ncbi:MAG: hypothetical protein H6740_28550 [Alphaproteobacteria bacterium]|nr:hypothetical protein [Alphaproteobacteria bacterium]
MLPSPALPPPTPRTDEVGPAPCPDPSRWHAPGVEDRPAPLLFTQGWPTCRASNMPSVDALVELAAASVGRPPRALRGSRVGELSALRAVLIALCADVLLLPVCSMAWMFCLTRRGADKAADRGRRILLHDRRARREVAALFGPLLGLELPR